MKPSALLSLLQFASPALPVGAYSYSEGLEILVEEGIITEGLSLERWLQDGLRFGSVRVEAAIVKRGYEAMAQGELEKLRYWNCWILAMRETEELRQQTLQMGRSLCYLLQELEPNRRSPLLESDWTYPMALAIASAHHQIPLLETLLAYLHSWAANLITAGVKLIPLGQTTGQQLLHKANPLIVEITTEILTLPEEHLYSCSWGLALASMAHETQYTRLFRS